MGKEAKSGKAGRNKGDGTTKLRVTARHKEVAAARRGRVLDKSRSNRDVLLASLAGVATKLGARISIRATPSRIKRDLIEFIAAPVDDSQQQRVLRLRYGRMNIRQFVTHLNAKMGG